MTYHDGDGEVSLWNDEEGFYFDAITWGPGAVKQLPIRSLVGLIPLYATLTLEPSTLKKFPGFKKRMEWFIENRSQISKRNIANMSCASHSARTVSLVELTLPRAQWEERATAVCSRSRPRTACAGFLSACSTRTSSSATTASARASPILPSPLHC